MFLLLCISFTKKAYYFAFYLIVVRPRFRYYSHVFISEYSTTNFRVLCGVKYPSGFDLLKSLKGAFIIIENFKLVIKLTNNCSHHF